MKQSVAELAKYFEEKYNEADAAEARMRAVAETWSEALERIQDFIVEEEGDEESEYTKEGGEDEDDAQLAAANDTISKLERENGRLSDRLLAADTKIETLVQDKTNLLRQIEKREAELRAKEADVTQLTEDKVKLASQRNAAMEELKLRRQENEQLTRERDAARAEINKLLAYPGNTMDKVVLL